MPLPHYQDAGADSSAHQNARTIPFPSPKQTHQPSQSMSSPSQQLINYLIYHKAMTMRMAEDKSIKPIDRCVWNALFVLWNESEWAQEIEASPAWIMDATGIGNKGTVVDALERLDTAGYITVKTSRGNRGGTFITLPPYSKEEISKWPKSGLFKNPKCTRSGLFEPEPNVPEAVYSNVPEVVYLEDSNRPEMVHSYTSIPTVQTTDNVVNNKQTFVPNGTSAGSAAPPKKKDSGKGRKDATPPPPKPTAPAGPKEKKVAPKKEKVESSTPHWRSLVAEWFGFHQDNGLEEPSFKGADPTLLKKITDELQRRVEKRGEAWTQAAAVAYLRKFLDLAFRDPWLSANFLLSNLEKQFDKILQSYGKPQSSATNRHQPATGGNINLDSAFDKIDRMYGNAVPKGS